jgi:hypothetical protein
MRRAILIIVLILSIFKLGGCVVISCEEHRHQMHPHAACFKTDFVVHEVHVIGF